MHGTAIRLEKVNCICANNRTSDVIDDVFTTGLNNSKACPSRANATNPPPHC